MVEPGAVSALSASQKPAPLSGGSPSPKVLASSRAWEAVARSLGVVSAMARGRAAMDCAVSCAATRAAASSARPVCEAQRIRISGPEGAGEQGARRARTSPPAGR
jgi:hypothetical protein